MSVFLLVPSPLLGSATWRPVEAWLRDRGHHVAVVDFGTEPRTPEQVVHAVVRTAGAGSVTLVPHSNAGLYAPQSSVPVPSGWAERSAAYLAFADTYAAELRFAEEAGWPTMTLSGRHLHQLVEPAVVGAAILELSGHTPT